MPGVREAFRTNAGRAEVYFVHHNHLAQAQAFTFLRIYHGRVKYRGMALTTLDHLAPTQEPL